MTNSGHRTCLDGLDRRRRPHLPNTEMIVESIRRDCPWPEPKTN